MDWIELKLSKHDKVQAFDFSLVFSGWLWLVLRAGVNISARAILIPNFQVPT